MQRQRHPSLRTPPIVFAHRGARAHARENTVPAFDLALKLGASGLESDVWITADGVAVLDHDGTVRRGLRRRRMRDLDRSTLPEHVPDLADLLRLDGDVQISLDLKDPGALDEVVRVVAAHGADDRVWLCHDDPDLLEEAAGRSGPRLVNSTSVRAMKEGPERRAARLAAAGIDAVNLRQSDWSGGLTTLFHRFEVLAFGWDAQHERSIRDLVWMGIDGVFGDDVNLLVDVVSRESGPVA